MATDATDYHRKVSVVICGNFFLKIYFMKRLFLYFLLACTVFFSTRTTAQIIKQQAIDETKISGEWWLLAVLPSDTVTGHIPNISFDLSKKKFKGFTGCNGMSGSFMVKGDALSFDKDIISTKIACEGFNEKDFIANLLRVDHYQIKDGVLIFLIDKSPISKWTRKTNKALTASR